MWGGSFMFPSTAWWEGQWTSYLPNPNPGQRAYFGLSARLSSGGLYLFGGQMPGIAASSELWFFSGGPDFFNPSGGWTLISTSGPARRAHGQAWDDARRQLVVFGGRSLSSQLLDDTWVWTDGSQSWTRITSPIAPSARERPAMGYDPLRRVIVLFGGIDVNDGTLNDTWEFDGERWNMVSAGGGGGPQGRAGASISWDPVRQRLVVFGGHSDPIGSIVLNETLEYVGFRSAYITRQPQDVRICQGQPIELSVEFYAPWPTQVQWYTVHPSGTQTLLPVEGPSISLASSTIPTGSQVFARIGGGTACSVLEESRRAAIRVDEAVTSSSLTISAGTNCVGSGMTLRASFGSPLVPGPFRWSRNGQPIATTVIPELTLSNLTLADAGNYECRPSTICSPNAVASAYVTIYSPPGSYSISAPASVFVGETMALMAVPSGVPGTVHQWQYRTTVGDTWSNLDSGDQESGGLRLNFIRLGRDALVSFISSSSSTVVIEFRVIVGHGCFWTISQSSTTVVRRACTPSDIAGPGQSIGSDGTLTADDIIVYLNWFFASDPRANVAGPGQNTAVIDADLTADDIIVFLNRFFAGC
jgi:hypothetical protein